MALLGRQRITACLRAQQALPKEQGGKGHAADTPSQAKEEVPAPQLTQGKGRRFESTAIVVVGTLHGLSSDPFAKLVVERVLGKVSLQKDELVHVQQDQAEVGQPVLVSAGGR